MRSKYASRMSFRNSSLPQLVVTSWLVGTPRPTSPEQLAECVPNLLNLIAQRQLKLFANHTFPLDQVRAAFEALASRQTTGKVVLIP